MGLEESTDICNHQIVRTTLQRNQLLNETGEFIMKIAKENQREFHLMSVCNDLRFKVHTDDDIKDLVQLALNILKVPQEVFVVKDGVRKQEYVILLL
jgi:hypothetical protein